MGDFSNVAHLNGYIHGRGFKNNACSLQYVRDMFFRCKNDSRTRGHSLYFNKITLRIRDKKILPYAFPQMIGIDYQNSALMQPA